MKSLHIGMMIAGALSLAACNNADESSSAKTAASATAPPPTATSVERPARVADTNGLTGSYRIPPFVNTGLPDCDRYAFNVRQCLNSHGSDEARRKAQKGVQNLLDQATAAAKNGSGQWFVAQCRLAYEQASHKYRPMGCNNF